MGVVEEERKGGIFTTLNQRGEKRGEFAKVWRWRSKQAFKFFCVWRKANGHLLKTRANIVNPWRISSSSSWLGRMHIVAVIQFPWNWNGKEKDEEEEEEER